MDKPRYHRRGVFIDVQNIFSTVRNLMPQARLNYQALKEYFVQDGIETTFTAFSSYDPDREEQRRFLMALALMGYRIITKPLKRLPSGEIKANMDMEIAMEILEVSHYLDEIVIVSGDGDFAPLVNRLVLRGKIVRVIGPDQFSAPELIQACHEFISLSRIAGLIETS
ncbi:MAG: NYN domain-containing protein [Bacteroidia bacterium]|nr:NYN domain-containing protein [Bacteroidia bacterium]MDW8235812.1 NYN domain-containing protein [Bacteroidia bacterium]